MPRYIDANLAIKAMEDILNDDIALYGCAIPECFDAETAIEAIDSIPTANVRENVTGKWIKDNHFLKCPICEQTQYAVEAYDWEDGEWTCFLKYCPNCGAKMEDADE